MLADNIQFLKKNYRSLFNAIKNQELQFNTTTLSLEITKNNEKTILMEDEGVKIYLHSRYDPRCEAMAVISNLAEKERIDENSHVVFFGLGLGYHIEAFAERFPNTEFSIYDPSPALFSLFLAEKSLKSSTMRKMVLLGCGFPDGGVDDFFKELFLKISDKTIVFLNLPIYERIFEKEYKQFFSEFKRFIREKRMNLHTEYLFQKDWVSNSITNLKVLLNTPNILMQQTDCFKNKPVVIVSAGPSLDYEIENLRKIKDEGLAFLFSVGSAINALLSYDILPDAVFGFEATNDILVYKKLIESGINEIPMVFGSRIGPEIIKKYTGPKYHFLVSLDQINHFFLRDLKGQEINGVIEAPSIAVIVQQLVYCMGFSQIILAGQNFSFPNNKNYAKGIEYQKTIDPETKAALEITIDVNGNEVVTDVGYNAMRRQMETYIERYKMSVINTTVDGAAIKGAEFIPMEKVIKEVLTKKVVNGNEFKNITNTDIYDQEFLKERIITMEQSFKEYHEILNEIKTLMSKIRPLIKNNNRNQAENMYNKLDRIIITLDRNVFFSLIAMPMNAVHYNYLCDQTDRIKTEKISFDKIKLFIDQLGLFVSHLSKDAASLTKIMEDLSSLRNILVN